MLLTAMGVLLASFVLIIGVLYEYFTSVSQSQLRIETGLAAKGVAGEEEAYFDGLDTSQYRITWIDSDGTVLYDTKETDANKMENHLERTEVQEALKSGYGESKRYSSTLMQQSLYAAQRLPDGTVVRLSIAQNSVISVVLGMLHPLCIVILLAGILSIILSVRLSRRIVRPLNNLNLDDPMSNEEYDELSPLLRRLDSQQVQLRAQERELRQRRQEFETIIGNMEEGILLLGPGEKIVSINQAAERLLGAKGRCIGHSLLTVSRNVDLQDAVQKAMSGENALQTTKIDGRIYQISASPVREEEENESGRAEGGRTGSGLSGGSEENISKGNIKGAAVMLLDVTEKELAEQHRREFSANVSHELRTPLHSISGYAELIKDRMVREEDIPQFAGKIYSEAQRMIQLVEDILNLSHLDAGSADFEWSQVDLAGEADLVCRDLQAAAEARKISLRITETSAETATFEGISHLVHEVVYNLCDNAVKYNREGGKIDVSVRDFPAGAPGAVKSDSAAPEIPGEEKSGRDLDDPEASRPGDDRYQERGVSDQFRDGYVQLTVRDTGIGIPRDQQDRIFERFYRVDKSHSKEVGGTGLGLSIVKHAVRIHGGTIHVQSEIGKGTTMTVRFPKKRQN